MRNQDIGYVFMFFGINNRKVIPLDQVVTRPVNNYNLWPKVLLVLSFILSGPWPWVEGIRSNFRSFRLEISSF